MGIQCQSSKHLLCRDLNVCTCVEQLVKTRQFPIDTTIQVQHPTIRGSSSLWDFFSLLALMRCSDQSSIGQSVETNDDYGWNSAHDDGSRQVESQSWTAGFPTTWREYFRACSSSLHSLFQNDWLTTEVCNWSRKSIHSFVGIGVGIEVNESIHRRLSVSIILPTIWPWNRGQWVSAMQQVVPRSSNNIECVFIWYVLWSSMSIEMMLWIGLWMPITHGSLCEDDREDFKECLLGHKRVRHFSSLCTSIKCWSSFWIDPSSTTHVPTPVITPSLSCRSMIDSSLFFLVQSEEKPFLSRRSWGWWFQLAIIQISQIIRLGLFFTPFTRFSPTHCPSLQCISSSIFPPSNKLLRSLLLFSTLDLMKTQIGSIHHETGSSREL